MWLVVSSLLPHNPQLLFCCVLSILALIWLVFVALFCAAIRRDSFYLLKFPFLSHVHVFSCEMLLVSRLKRPQNCFSPHFFLIIFVLLVLVLSVLFLLAVISLLLAFLFSLRVVSIRQRSLPCWKVLFLFPFLTHIIIIIIYLLEFFPSALADGLSLEFERQQVSSSLQDSS